MAYAFLDDINPQSHQWTIKARVVRFSEYLSTDQPPKVLRLDLIVVDEKGTAMDAQVPGNNVPKFAPSLKEDTIYIIKHFFVVSARALYRPVQHPYLIKFTMYTKLSEVKDTPHKFPRYVYALTPYEELDARIGIYTYCSDIIGVFRGCTHVKVQNTSKGEKALRNICISNGSQEIPIALWGRHAHEFDADSYMEMATRGPVILLFVGMTCTRFDGRVSVVGSSLCRWYHNPEIPEAAALQETCTGQMSLPTWYGPGPSQVVPQKITFAQLAAFDNPHLIFANRYIVTINIKAAVPGRSWWYCACELCNKGMKENNVNNKCTKPGCPSTSGRNRYRVPLIATDPAPSLRQESNPVELVLFGNVAEELIGVPVNVLISSGAGVGAFLPQPIVALFGKQYEVRLSVSPLSMTLDNIIYQVDRILGVINASPFQTPTATQQLTSQTQRQPANPQPNTVVPCTPVISREAVSEHEKSCPSTPASIPSLVNDIPDKTHTQDDALPESRPSLTQAPPASALPEEVLPSNDAGHKRTIEDANDNKPADDPSSSTLQNTRRVRRRLDMNASTDS